MTDCIFCKIIKGEIPCAKVYEDDKIMAFLDIQPVNEGHTLVVPKRHHEDLFDLPEEFLSSGLGAIKKIARAVQKAVDADGVNIGMNNGRAAGQAVFHAHFHIIPRYNKDELGEWPRKAYQEGEIGATARRIRDIL